MTLNEIDSVIKLHQGRIIIWRPSNFEVLEKEWLGNGGYLISDSDRERREGLEYKGAFHRWDVQDEEYKII